MTSGLSSSMSTPVYSNAASSEPSLHSTRSGVTCTSHGRNWARDSVQPSGERARKAITAQPPGHGPPGGRRTSGGGWARPLSSRWARIRAAGTDRRSRGRCGRTRTGLCGPSPPPAATPGPRAIPRSAWRAGTTTRSGSPSAPRLPPSCALAAEPGNRLLLARLRSSRSATIEQPMITYKMMSPTTDDFTKKLLMMYTSTEMMAAAVRIVLIHPATSHRPDADWLAPAPPVCAKASGLSANAISMNQPNDLQSRSARSLAKIFKSIFTLFHSLNQGDFSHTAHTFGHTAVHAIPALAIHDQMNAIGDVPLRRRRRHLHPGRQGHLKQHLQGAQGPRSRCGVQRRHAAAMAGGKCAQQIEGVVAARLGKNQAIEARTHGMLNQHLGRQPGLRARQHAFLVLDAQRNLARVFDEADALIARQVHQNGVGERRFSA